MLILESIEAILEFAVNKEQEAADYYARLAEKADSPPAADLFTSLSSEELEHKAKIQAMKQGLGLKAPPDPSPSVRIALDESELPDPSGLGFLEALELAMEREKASYKLYTDLAQVAVDPEQKSLLRALAGEEAEHKLRIEMEFEDRIR